MNSVEYEIMFAHEDTHWWYVALHELIMYFLNIEFEAKGALDIFDAGCGTGRLCQLMGGLGKVTGCDMSLNAIELSNKRGIRDIIAADLNTVDLGKDCYDVITSIDVLYHKAIADDCAVLQKLFIALRPGGVLILNLVAYNFLKSRHDIAVHTKRRYTKSALTEMMKKLGYIIEKTSYRLCFLFLPIAVYRLLQKPWLHRLDPNKTVSDLSQHGPFVNTALLYLARLENRIIRRASLPFGTSVFIVARKPF